MKLELNIDLCFWALPVTLRWDFNIPGWHYIALHVLCFELLVEWK